MGRISQSVIEYSFSASNFLSDFNSHSLQNPARHQCIFLLTLYIQERCVYKENTQISSNSSDFLLLLLLQQTKTDSLYFSPWHHSFVRAHV